MQDFPSGDDLTTRSALLSGTSPGSAINAEASTNTTELNLGRGSYVAPRGAIEIAKMTCYGLPVGALRSELGNCADIG